MSKSVERLANALQDCVEPPGRKERTEKLASALQACFNEATQTGIREIKESEARVNARLDKVDASLREVWRYMKGNGSLPIDGD